MRKFLSAFVVFTLTAPVFSTSNTYYLKAEIGEIIDYLDTKGVPALDLFSFMSANDYNKAVEFLNQTKLKISDIQTVLVSFDISRLQDKKFPGIIGIKIRGKNAQTIIKTILALIPAEKEDGFIPLERSAGISLHTSSDYIAIGRPSELKKIQSKKNFQELKAVLQAESLEPIESKSAFLVHWSWDKKTKDQLLDLARSKKEANVFLRNPYVKTLLGTKSYTSYVLLNENITSVTRIKTEKGTSNANLQKIAYASQVIMSIAISAAEAFSQGAIGVKKDSKNPEISQENEARAKKLRILFDGMQNFIVRMSVQKEDDGIKVSSHLKGTETNQLLSALKDRIKTNKARIDNERKAGIFLGKLCKSLEQTENAQKLIRENKKTLSGRKFYEYSYHTCEGDYLILKLAAHKDENLLKEFLPNDISSIVNSMPTRSADYRNVLHISAEQGKLNTVTYLVEGGMYIDAVDGAGKNALFIAAEKNHIPVVKYLLGKGSVIMNDSSGESPVSIAEKAGHKEMVNLLKNASK